MVIIGFVPFAIPLNIPFIHTHMYILNVSSGQVKTVVWFSHHMSQIKSLPRVHFYIWESIVILPFSGCYLLTEKYFRCLIACEKVKPLSSSMSF